MLFKGCSHGCIHGFNEYMDNFSEQFEDQLTVCFLNMICYMVEKCVFMYFETICFQQQYVAKV